MTTGAENQEIGRLGEAIAARYLVKHGYTVILRNFLVQGLGEVDIIAHRDGVLHFVEVKASYTYCLTDELHPVANFDDHKKARVARVMRRYCDEHDVTMPRTVSLAAVYFSRETYEAHVSFEPFVMLDTI